MHGSVHASCMRVWQGRCRGHIRRFSGAASGSSSAALPRRSRRQQRTVGQGCCADREYRTAVQARGDFHMYACAYMHPSLICTPHYNATINVIYLMIEPPATRHFMGVITHSITSLTACTREQNFDTRLFTLQFPVISCRPGGSDDVAPPPHWAAFVRHMLVIIP